MKKTLPILIVLILTLAIITPIPAYSIADIAADSITVNTGLDVINGSDSLCSLREAVIAANTDTASGLVKGECSAGSGVDTIILGARTHDLTIAGDDIQDATLGDLDILESVNFYGAGKDLAIIDANGIDRIFHVPYAGVTLRIEDLTITQGGLGDDDGGAGVMSEAGLLVVENVIFRRNVIIGSTSGNAGGAIEAKGGLQVTNCLFDDNYANRGGAVFVAGGVTWATIEKSLFIDNDAQYGGALMNYGELTIENTTFTGNGATRAGGGAINNLATMTLKYSTLVGNRSNGSESLGRAGALDNGPSATITVRATILAGNEAKYSPAQVNCNQGGTWLESPFNLEDDDTCPFGLTANLYNTDPELGPLGTYGGPTQTFPLLYGSQAIDSGGNTECPDDDQRSFTRPIDGNDVGGPTCDIGAFEAEHHYHILYLPLVIK